MPQPERKLGTWPIFVIAVSAMTPLTVVAGALPLGYGKVGEKGIPVAYMLVAAILGIFAVGLAAMARHVPNSGAFYAYAAIGISRPLGVGTAFVALLAYNAMQIGLYGAFGVAAHHALAIFGIEISWIVLALIGWAVIAALGRLDIDLNARILTVLVGAEVLIVLIFDAVMIGNPAGGTVSFDTLNPALLASAGGVSLLVAAIAGMVGFEAPLVYAAEARDPRRTIARAIGFTLLVAAFLYGGTAWAMSVVAGPDRIVAVAGDHLSDLFFFLPAPYLPSVIIDLGRIFFATSLFAAMLAFHHTVARYGLTVAREGVLPEALAVTRRGVPVAASLAQSVLALVVLLIFAVGAWNPTDDLFFFGTVSGGLGVLILMTIASVAVVRFFRRAPSAETRWRRSIAPWTATVFLGIVLLITVAFFGDLLGSDNLAKVWSPTLSFLLVLIIGIVRGKRLRTRRPEVYAVIGTGHPPLAPGESAPPVVIDTDPSPVPAAPEGGGPARKKDAREPQEGGWAGQGGEQPPPGANRARKRKVESGRSGDPGPESGEAAGRTGEGAAETEVGSGTGAGSGAGERPVNGRRSGTASVVDNRIENPPEDSRTTGAEAKPKPSPRPRTPRPRRAAPGAAGPAGDEVSGPGVANTAAHGGGAPSGSGRPATGDSGPVLDDPGAATGGAGRRTPSPRKRAAGGRARNPGGPPDTVSENGTAGAAPRVPRSRAAADDGGPAGDGSADSGTPDARRRPPRPRRPRDPGQTPAAETENPDETR